MKLRALVVAAVLLVAGCAIEQTIKPVKETGFDEVCIIRNPAVRAGFLAAYQHAIEENGHKVRVLAADAPLSECDVTTTYTANWQWDMATYMAYAHMKVFRQGQMVGEALYDSTRGGGRGDKFIKADEKVHELATALFPKQ